MSIDFAYTPFVWNNESHGQAKVHCVIVGFSCGSNGAKEKRLYADKSVFKNCQQISPYLTDTPVIFIEYRATPLCNVPPMKFGNMPRDGGGFSLSPEERAELLQKEPLSAKWIRPYVGATEFLNNKERYCLWLVGANPSEIRKCPTVKQRIELVRKTRAESKATSTRKFADTPTLFCQIAQPNTDYLLVPRVSSEKRKYVPIGFMTADVIVSDAVQIIPDASLYHFGVLTSNVHMAWMRTVCGRLEMRYRYSKDIVYNNFPWPTPTEEQRAEIEKTAQAILDARAIYPDCSLADLYDSNAMPPELSTAHQRNDKAVMQAYGFWGSVKSESACVAELMRLYQQLSAGK